MPYADNAGIRIHYVVEGSGPPLVLQHGFTGSWRDWETFGFVDGLKLDYRLIMLDARGHGASDKPHDPARYGFEHSAGDIVAVLDDLGIAQAHYYGYSFGGLLGWAIGAHAPGRFASIAIGGAHPYPPSEEFWARGERLRHYLRQGMDAYVTWRESQVGPWPAAFRERGLRNDARALAAFVTGDERQRARWLDGAIARMTMPVLLVSGDDDELYAGSRARHAAGELPSATFVEISNASHFTLYVGSDLVLPHLRAFLARVAAGPVEARR